MSQRIFQKRYSPHPFPHSFSKNQQYQKQLADESNKQPLKDKLLIAPNRDSKPLTTTINKGFTELPNQQRFQPSFDNFSLSCMFANKIMNQDEVKEFKKENPSDLQLYATPIRKKNENNIFFSRTSELQQGGKTAQQIKKSRPKEKGLRKLSQRAYEIVLNLRSASYKEVANKLVDQLNNEKQIDEEVIKGQLKGKDEQNIKRRVYDALNVLIALGVLRKEGRRIVGDRSLNIESQSGDLQTLRKEMIDKEMRLKMKKEKMQFQKAKREIALKLLEQNRHRQSLHIQTQKISIPFMVIRGQKRVFENVRFDQNSNCKQIELRTNISNLCPAMDLDFYTQYSLPQKN